VFGHKVLPGTDNKDLSFLQKCTLTSNRIAMWILQPQEHDTQISHISGIQNYLAYIISHHPTGLTLEQIKQLTRARYIMVAAIGLNIHPQVKKELKDSAAYQDNDPYIKNLKDQVTNQPAEVHDWRYAVVDGVIHCKNHEGYPV
jgi:hypothetical protein